MTQPILYRHANWMSAPHRRTSPDDARVISSLADTAIETAREFGVSCARREAIARAKDNLAWARAEIARVTG